MEFRQARLDNGLRIIAEVNPSAASMAAGFFVRTGSRDETAGIAGVSHYLEHMVFKGTARRSAADVNRDFDEIGAHYNAFTTEENTVYFGGALPEFQTRLLDILADLMRPALRAEDFDLEKKVILEEIAQYLDRPNFRLYEALMARHFDGHPLGQSILGTTESITALRREQMREYFDRRYSPTNVTAVAVGKVDFPALVEDVGRLCSHWRPLEAPREAIAPKTRAGRGVIADAKVAREHVGIISPAPAAQEESRYAAELVAAIVGDDTGSRLYYALVEPAWVDEASTAYEALDGAGAFVTFLSADAGKAARAAEIAMGELKRFVEAGPTAEELQSAKNKIASSATLKGEVPMGRLTAVGFDWVYRRTYQPLPEQIDALYAVTAEQVADVARRCNLAEATMIALGPLEAL